MRRHVGYIDIDTIAAERSKFTSPLILVHGLWCTNSIWHRLMGYLAHRGWDCHAVNLRGRSSNPKQPPPSSNLADHCDDLNAAILACDAAPVVIGHDFGGLLGLSSRLAPARAVVAIAPLLPPPWRQTPLPGTADVRARIALRLADRLPPPRGKTARQYFGATPPRPIVAETGALARDLRNPALPFPIGPKAPTLIVAGDADDVTPPAAITKMAETVGAEVQLVANGGHALPWEHGWQERATELHRWLVRTLGDSLLIPEEEESE